MKFVVTSVPISQRTRRRTGKACVDVVDTSKVEHYAHVDTPLAMEIAYESYQRAVGEDVKVVDVREVKA